MSAANHLVRDALADQAVLERGDRFSKSIATQQKQDTPFADEVADISPTSEAASKINPAP